MSIDKLTIRLVLLLAVPAAALFVGVGSAVACGGFFCQTDPVDQTGERIVFTINDDDTITSLIEILYEGSAADFSWILPIPAAIDADDLAVPDDGPDVFTELHDLTDVRIIPPPMPECAEIAVAASAEDDAVDEAGDVEVFASGEVGPFGFDVIGSEDPDALITWLLDNNYRVEPSMEPLIDVYVEEDFAFVAMRLLQGETAESITPIELTYPGTQPMIPIRLTAVAAMPDMPIFTWIFADEQAVPTNYAHMEIATAEITFSPFGFDNYRRLVADRADANNGQAFITEFAGPGSSLGFTQPYLLDRSDRYLTRLFSIISPEEMTVDPVFDTEQRPDVSNVRDASQLVGLYDCQREPFNEDDAVAESDALDPFGGGTQVLAAPAQETTDSDDGTTDDDTTDDGTTDEDAIGEAGGADDSDDPLWPWLVGGLVVIAAIGGAFAFGRSRSATT